MEPNVLLLTVTHAGSASPSEARAAAPHGGDGDFLRFLRQFDAQVDPELFRKVFAAIDAAMMPSPFPQVNPMPLPVMPVVGGKLVDGTAALKPQASMAAGPVELYGSTRETPDGAMVVEQKLRKAKDMAPEMLLLALPAAVAAVRENRPQAKGDVPMILAESEDAEMTVKAQPDSPAAQAVAQALVVQAQTPAVRGAAIVIAQPEDGEEAAVGGEQEGETSSEDEAMLESQADGLPQLPAPPLAIEQGPAGKPHPEMPEAAEIHAKSQASERALEHMPSAVREAVVNARPAAPTDLPRPDMVERNAQAAIADTGRPARGHEKEITAEVAMMPQAEAAPALLGEAADHEMRVSAPEERRAFHRHFAETGLRIAQESAPDMGTQQQPADGGPGDRPRFATAPGVTVTANTVPVAPEMTMRDRHTVEDTAEHADRVAAEVLTRHVDVPATGVHRAQPAQAHEARVAGVEPQRVIDQIVTAVRMEAAGSRRELIVRLDPPELGTVHIRVSVDTGSGMSVHVEASAPWVRDMLDTRLQELRRSFTDLGINVDQYSVSLRMDTSPEQANGGQAGAQYRQGGQARQAGGDITPPPAPEPVRIRREHHGALDLLA